MWRDSMTNQSDRLKDIIDDGLVNDTRAFGDAEEDAIVSYILDNPGFYSSISAYITPDLFKKPESRKIIQVVSDMFEKHETIPPRPLVIEAVRRTVTVNDEYQSLLALLERQSDPREAAHIKTVMMDWAKDQAYGLIYSVGVDAYESKDYETLDQLIDRAQKITDDTGHGLRFYDSMEVIFNKESKEHFGTGFIELDKHINVDMGGMGPCRKEVCCWMAPTGVGKTTMLVNNAIQGMIDGKKVLYITMETSAEMISVRTAGAISNIPTKERMQKRQKVEKQIEIFRQSFYAGDLYVYEYPPDEISVDNIYDRIKKLNRLYGWQPDIIVIDYMELMMSRRSSSSDNEYMRQKKVATEIRGLAINENVIIFTAIQTNRSGAVADGTSKNIGLDKVAESYGKLMPLDYVFSINQNEDERLDNRARIYIEKNRNGPKGKMVPIKINYETQKMSQDENMGVQI